MLFKLGPTAGAALLVCAGTALAGGVAVEHVIEPSADSYYWWANQPHGDKPYLEMFQDLVGDRQSIAMMAFDLSAFAGVDPAWITSARLELVAGYSENAWNFNGDWGLLNIKQRASAFDEIDPNPAPDSIGDPLAELFVPMGTFDPMVLEGQGLLDLVRDWVADPQTNFGVDIYFEALADTNFTFYMAIGSRHNQDVELRPRLIVTEIPAPSTALLVLSGALGVARRRR